MEVLFLKNLSCKEIVDTKYQSESSLDGHSAKSNKEKAQTNQVDTAKSSPRAIAIVVKPHAEKE